MISAAADLSQSAPTVQAQPSGKALDNHDYYGFLNSSAPGNNSQTLDLCVLMYLKDNYLDLKSLDK